MRTKRNDGTTAVAEVPLGRPDGTPITFYVGQFEGGYTQAVASGKNERDPKTEQQGAAFAENSARALGAAAFDPENNAADRHIREHREREVAKLALIEEQIQHAAVARRDAERALADEGDPPERPETPYLVGLLGALGIAVTITLTLHDLVFVRVFDVPEQAITASAVCGLLISGLSVYGLLGSARHPLSLPAHGFYVGLCALFGVSLLALRLGAGSTERDKWIGVGFAGLELVAVLIVELYTYGLRQRWQAYESSAASYAKAAAAASAAAAYEADRLQARSALQEEIDLIESKIAKRESLVRSTPLVVAAARDSWILGYLHGIEGNRAHLVSGRTIRKLNSEEIAALLARRLTLPEHSADDR